MQIIKKFKYYLKLNKMMKIEFCTYKKWNMKIIWLLDVILSRQALMSEYKKTQNEINK